MHELRYANLLEQSNARVNPGHTHSAHSGMTEFVSCWTYTARARWKPLARFLQPVGIICRRVAAKIGTLATCTLDHARGCERPSACHATLAYLLNATLRSSASNFARLSSRASRSTPPRSTAGAWVTWNSLLLRCRSTRMPQCCICVLHAPARRHVSRSMCLSAVSFINF